MVANETRNKNHWFSHSICFILTIKIINSNSMKKITFISLAVLLFIGCTKKETGSTSKNYLPETPQLTSDIMTPEVLWSFGRLGGAQVSPDGETVLYTVTYYNLEENKSYRDIYSIQVVGGEPKNLTNSPGNEFNMVWQIGRAHV